MSYLGLYTKINLKVGYGPKYKLYKIIKSPKENIGEKSFSSGNKKYFLITNTKNRVCP